MTRATANALAPLWLLAIAGFGVAAILLVDVAGDPCAVAVVMLPGRSFMAPTIAYGLPVASIR